MVETYDNGEIIDTSELESYHIFHETHRNNIDSILSNGFSPKFDRSQENDEKYIQAVADKLRLTYSVDRINASYFYPDLSSVKDRSSYGGYTIVVDARKLKYPVYVAEVELYDAVFNDAPHMESIDDLDESQMSIGRKYLDSLEEIRSVSRIQPTSRKYDFPEVIVDSGIPMEAIVGYIKV